MSEPTPKVSRVLTNRWAIAILSFALAVLFGGLQVVVTRQMAIEGARAKPAPIRYLPTAKAPNGEWVPDKNTYRPGELATFTFLRQNDLKAKILILATEGLAEDTAGTFIPSGTFVREVGLATHVGTQSRYLPADLQPGTYRLVGTATPQVSERSLPALYRSLPFTVTKD